MREKAKKKKAGKKVAGLNIKRMKVEDLVPADYNPRTITEDALVGLGRSVEEFGLVEPLVWNKRTGRLVSGHQRLKILARQGVDEADVSVVDLDDAREKVLNVTLNNQVIQGEWNRNLPSLLDGLKEHSLETGLFGELKLDELLNVVELDNLANFKKPDLDGSNVPSIPGKEDGNWFFVEFYGQDELYVELTELLAGHLRTGHEIKATDFVEMLRVWKQAV